jgi:hypothetical protein
MYLLIHILSFLQFLVIKLKDCFCQFGYFHSEMVVKASSGTTKRLASSHRDKEGDRFELITNVQLVIGKMKNKNN